MFYLKLFLIVSIIGVTTALHENKPAEGYSDGYLSACPMKYPTVPKEHLNFLELVLHGAKSLIRSRYNYYQAHMIAKDPNVDWTRNLMIYIGGYVDSSEFENARNMEQAYIKIGYNVMVMNAAFFDFEEFPIVARRVRVLGRHVAEMLSAVYYAGALNLTNTEMVGLSLGGQTMSYIAKEFYKITGKKIGKLIGLDPSGPCFRNLPPTDRLTHTDAEFVVVLHTNIDMSGMAAAMGHVDFYVNGGEYQVEETHISIFCNSYCSHIRAHRLWLAVVSTPSTEFIGIKCKNIQQARFRECYDNVPRITNVLGFDTDREKPGIFYLATYNYYPFFMGEKGLVKENDNLIADMQTVFKYIKKKTP